MEDDLQCGKNMTPMEFHPCDTPRGMLYYNMDILTKEQQHRLNYLKLKTVKENLKYLARHPEIRACVSIITKLVLKQRPKSNIHEVVGEYFSKSRVDIEADVREYYKMHRPGMYEALSQLDMFGNRSETSDSYESLFTSSSSSTSSESSGSFKGSSIWKFDIPDIDTEALQMEVSDSLKNIGIEYDKIRKVSSDALVHSISVVTQTAEDDEKEIKTPSVIKPEHITINEYLRELESISFADMEEEMEDEGPYTGHIPRLEDYDAGYGRRRKTFEAGQVPFDEIDGPIADYMAGILDAGTENVIAENYIMDPLEASVADEPSYSQIQQERVIRSSLDTVTRTMMKQSKSNIDTKETDAKALTAKRSVRISSIAESDPKDIDNEFDDDKRQVRTSKDERRSPDEGERRVRTNRERISLDERGNKFKPRTDKAIDQSNKLHLDNVIIEEKKEEMEEETKQETKEEINCDENAELDPSEPERSDKTEELKLKSNLSKSKQVSVQEPDGNIRESKSIIKDDKGNGIKSSSKNFDGFFKSVSHMKDDESPSKSNIYFKSEDDKDDDVKESSDSATVEAPVAEESTAVYIRSKLEQKVSFSLNKIAFDEQEEGDDTPSEKTSA